MQESSDVYKIKEEILECAKFISSKGWTPATSGNFSARVPGHSDFIAITCAGVDKNRLRSQDIMLINSAGKSVEETSMKASGETALHLALYQNDSTIGAAFHTHSIYSTYFSVQNVKERTLVFENLEILKAFRGIRSCRDSVMLPILKNWEEVEKIASDFVEYWKKEPTLRGYLIEGHGLWTWGQNIQEARRHTEAFEYLLEYQALWANKH